MDVTVAIATFGSASWADLAFERAIPSVQAVGVEWVHSHADRLDRARNYAFERVETEWVCFLDADDELEPGYFDTMGHGTADLRAPSVAYVRNGRRQAPYMPKVAGHRHACSGECLPEGNWLVVGSVVRAELVANVGGWRDWPMYEDWDLWLRCWQAGATVEAVPSAVYRAHWHTNSRNRAPSRDERHRVHQAIARANKVPVPA